MQFDQAGHDEVAAGVLACRRRMAFAEFRNAAIGKGDPAGLDNAVRQNNPGIGKYSI
jgi:hypothetical protein